MKRKNSHQTSIATASKLFKRPPRSHLRIIFWTWSRRSQSLPIKILKFAKLDHRQYLQNTRYQFNPQSQPLSRLVESSSSWGSLTLANPIRPSTSPSHLPLETPNPYCHLSSHLENPQPPHCHHQNPHQPITSPSSTLWLSSSIRR